jgi:hypothetical protein
VRTVREMKKWLWLAIALLAILAITARWWAPALLRFTGANTDLIQGLSGLVQLLLWVGMGVSWGLGLKRRRSGTKPGPHRAAGSRAGGDAKTPEESGEVSDSESSPTDGSTPVRKKKPIPRPDLRKYLSGVDSGMLVTVLAIVALVVVFMAMMAFWSKNPEVAMPSSIPVNTLTLTPMPMDMPTLTTAPMDIPTPTVIQADTSTSAIMPLDTPIPPITRTNTSAPTVAHILIPTETLAPPGQTSAPLSCPCEVLVLIRPFENSQDLNIERSILEAFEKPVSRMIQTGVGQIDVKVADVFTDTLDVDYIFVVQGRYDGELVHVGVYQQDDDYQLSLLDRCLPGEANAVPSKVVIDVCKQTVRTWRAEGCYRGALELVLYLEDLSILSQEWEEAFRESRRKGWRLN